jgi:hypothetical protein
LSTHSRTIRFLNPYSLNTRTLLTDRQSLHYFELPKLPELIRADDELKLWLSLFKVETMEELKRIEELEVPVMQQVIRAYHSITATPEFREIERLRSKARNDEAQALYHAEQVGEERANTKWQVIVADKDTENARLREQLAALQAQLGQGK